MSKVALVTGITGQDGSYLAELLLSKGYEVHGVIRRSSTFNTSRIDHIFDDLRIHYGDLTDGGGLHRLLHKVRPDEVYNLGAMSHVKVSFEVPEYTAHATGVSALMMLEAVKEAVPGAKFYQASSSELFGSSPPPQSEITPFHPRSPYGCAKLFAYATVINYREAHGIHASNGILFNHESPRRGETFVTRKITRAVARIKKGLQKELILGNLQAKRDWGFAGDFVEAMWLILQQGTPDDFVIATGETHTVAEFAEVAFSYAGLDWQEFVRMDPRYFRPSEVDALLGDASKARQLLGWQPKTTFKELAEMMVQHDLNIL